MGRTAKVGLFLLMGLVVALARLIEVEVGRARAGSSENISLAVGVTAPPAPKHTPHPVPHAPKHHVPAPAAKAPASAPTTPALVAPRPASSSEPGAEWPKGPVYTVRKGETPGEIAQKLLGSAKLWPRIYAANRARLSGPDAVRAGVRLIVPARETLAAHEDE